MPFNLTSEQEECIERALEGHNFSIFGEAGTGKSQVIAEIGKLKGNDVQVVCSTGIACEVFQGNTFRKKPITVHSFLGIGTAQGTFESLVEKSARNPDVCRRIKEAKCVIWDECSMSSARLLELFHGITSKVRSSCKPFGGIQTIVVGDWLQLKPVADNFDDGLPMFKSPIFSCLLPHTITLSVIHRQDPSEEKYRSLLKKVRLGVCDAEVIGSFRSLKRPVVINEQKKVVHLYFTNVLVDAHNALRLADIANDKVSFVAEDKGDVNGARWPVPSTACFKPGAPVMVLYNIGQNIHNGTTGVFIEKVDEDSARIKLDSGGQYVIKKVVWTNVDKAGKIIGSRCQIPLRLNWASTVHKAQGLTLDKIVIHSCFEFTGGLLYTALSRVRSIDDVQVIGFNQYHVRSRTEEVGELDSLPNGDYKSCSCFQENQKLNEISQLDGEWPWDEDIPDEVLEQLANEMFDEEIEVEELNAENPEILTPVINATVNMEELLELTEHSESLYSTPPEDFSYQEFLQFLKGFEYFDSPSNHGYLKNLAIETAIHNIEKFKILMKIIWYKEYLLFKKHLKENISDVRMSSKDMKQFYQRCLDINRTTEYQNMLKISFQIDNEVVTELTPVQISIGMDIVVGIMHNLIHVITEAARRCQQDEMSTMNVRDMDSDGLGKIRFVGGWAIGKCLKKARKYVEENKDSDYDSTRAHVKENILKIQAIEGDLVVPYDIISGYTKHPETLHVTEARQYRTHGLIHVSDQYFEFILDLEQRRIENLNTNMLRKCGEHLIEMVEQKLLCDKSLIEKWKNLFTEMEMKVAIVMKLYYEVIKRYINVAANQFLKSFRHTWQVKKTMAHRHMVLARKEKRTRKEAKVALSEISSDTTPNKVRSHHRLKELAAKFGVAIYCSIYTRKELVQLCSSYGVTPKSSMNKGALGKLLRNAINNSTSIPYPWSIGQLQVRPLEGRAVGIRIRRT